VGVPNTSGVSVEVAITVLDASGAERASTTWTLARYQHRQVSLPSLGVTGLAGGTVVFEQQPGPRSARGYVSTVDGVTGDAVHGAAQ